MDARDLVTQSQRIADPAAIASVRRFFTGADPLTTVMGVPIGKVFPVAKAFVGLSLTEIEALLADTRYEVRMAAVAVMDFMARTKGLPDADRQALYALYLRRHDRINNWDLVDRAAPHVVGEYLRDKDRLVLDRLAQSQNPDERRTAIVATYAFIRRGEVADTFRIATILAGDHDAYVQKAVASWAREAGKRDPAALTAFLTACKSRLPRATFSAAAKLLPQALYP